LFPSIPRRQRSRSSGGIDLTGSTNHFVPRPVDSRGYDLRAGGQMVLSLVVVGCQRHGLCHRGVEHARGQVEDDAPFFLLPKRYGGLDRFWSWAGLTPGPALGCCGQVSYSPFFFCFQFLDLLNSNSILNSVVQEFEFMTSYKIHLIHYWCNMLY
jgi:hypothetical protein